MSVTVAVEGLAAVAGGRVGGLRGGRLGWATGYGSADGVRQAGGGRAADDGDVGRRAKDVSVARPRHALTSAPYRRDEKWPESRSAPPRPSMLNHASRTSRRRDHEGGHGRRGGDIGGGDDHGDGGGQGGGGGGGPANEGRSHAPQESAIRSEAATV